MQTKRGSSSWFLSLVLKHPRLQLSVNTTQHIISGICSNYHQKVSSASETHLNYKNGFWINMLQVIWSKIFFFNPKQPKINNNPPPPQSLLAQTPTWILMDSWVPPGLSSCTRAAPSCPPHWQHLLRKLSPPWDGQIEQMCNSGQVTCDEPINVMDPSQTAHKPHHCDTQTEPLASFHSESWILLNTAIPVWSCVFTM